MGEPATFFGYRELPKEPADAQWLFQEMIRIQHENGATWSRCTIVSDEHPLPPYQNGLYVEGWRKRPKNEGEFSFPVTDHPNGGPPVHYCHDCNCSPCVCDNECWNCGGEGFTYGCDWDWQCDTWDGDSCLCTRRCEWCNPPKGNT